MQNPRTFTDEALPSGNGTAALALLRLGHLLGETRYLEAAERCLRAGSEALAKYPDAWMLTWLGALREFHAPRAQVVIRFRDQEELMWRDALRKRAPRGRMHSSSRRRTRRPGCVLAQRKPRKGGIAYVCTGLSCRAPVHSPRKLAGVLSENS